MLVKLVKRYSCDKCGKEEDTELELPLGWLGLFASKPKPKTSEITQRQVEAILPNSDSWTRATLMAELKALEINHMLEENGKRIHVCELCCLAARKSLGMDDEAK